MNAIQLLTQQHRQMEKALEAVLQAEPSKQRALFESVADELMAHVVSEETLFYPAVKAKRTEDILLESLEEHLSLKRILADVLVLRTSDEHFAPKVQVLKEQAEHHHQEEEEKLFPTVKKLLNAEELEALGGLMAADQALSLEGQPRKSVVRQTSKAADLV